MAKSLKQEINLLEQKTKILRKKVDREMRQSENLLEKVASMKSQVFSIFVIGILLGLAVNIYSSAFHDTFKDIVPSYFTSVSIVFIIIIVIVRNVFLKSFVKPIEMERKQILKRVNRHQNEGNKMTKKLMSIKKRLKK